MVLDLNRPVNVLFCCVAASCPVVQLYIQHHGKEESGEDSEVRLWSQHCGFPEGDDEPHL